MMLSLGLSAFTAVADGVPPGASASPATVPGWVFPLNPGPAGGPARHDGTTPLHVPNSKVSYNEAQLNDLFFAPDWHPKSHSPMPEVVAQGRRPDVYACGFCHTPTGQGRPENASLAGLPAPYIVQQVAEFKSGARRGAWPGPYRPTEFMIHTAAHATADEVASAARYFSQQILDRHVQIRERVRVPRSLVVGWVYAAIPGGGDEPLGDRLLEFTPDPTRHERREDDIQYVAYVPPGSVRRGRALVNAGTAGSALACAGCHGGKLQGVGLVPRLAGRSPSYLLRQLLAFQNGNRAGAGGKPMATVVARLKVGDMIDAVAYAASLQP